jgi:lipopolysaccharide export system protein LptA
MHQIRPCVSLAAAIVALALGSGPSLAQEGPANQGGAQSRISGLRLNGNEPIQIESDKLEVREAENMAVFTGNVSVTQGPTLLKSGRMTVFYAKDGGSATTGSASIDHLEVDDKVYVKSESQVATGDRGVFDMKTEVLVLSGKEVVLSEGTNVLSGCKLTVQMKTGQAKVEGCSEGGRVIMSITPGSTKK